MKKILFYMLMGCLLQVTALGFGDSTKTKRTAVKKSFIKSNTQKSAATSEKKCADNCDKECAEKCAKSKDVFIDKDNDGICDSRAKGMGFNSKNRCSEDGCAKQMKKKNK